MREGVKEGESEGGREVKREGRRDQAREGGYYCTTEMAILHQPIYEQQSRAVGTVW